MKVQNYSIRIIALLISRLKNIINLPSLIIAFLLIFPYANIAQSLLSAPQKIVIDSKRNRLLVSNYNTGDLVQIDNLGKQSYFVKDAGFVDGLEIVGDKVYGAGKNSYIIGIDLVTGKTIMKEFIYTSGNYLSSVTYDSSGHLFISCPQKNIIYKLRLSDNKYWVFASDRGLDKPNGILLEKEKNRIVVIDDSPSPAKIHAISLTDSTQITTLATTNFDRPDGIVRDKQGNYYVGGYYLQGIYKYDSNFSQPPTLYYRGNSFVYPTYDEVNNSLLVTSYNNNSWDRIAILTDIKEPTEIPSDIKLYQNYPNPFNPATTIKYLIKNKIHVRLTILNVLGETIKVLVNETNSEGIHESYFNTNDLSSGIYYYQLIAGNFLETKKMILVK